jgi:hypothetical protein
VGAAAAVVVAGVWVGAGWARIDGGDPHSGAEATARIEFSFAPVGIIEFIQRPFDQENLKDSVEKFTPIKPGNLGLVKVLTNAGRWDVEFITENGGRLYAPGAKKGMKPDLSGDCADRGLLNRCPDIEDFELGEYLMYSRKNSKTTGSEDKDSARIVGVEKDTVILRVSIGAADSVPSLYPQSFSLGQDIKGTLKIPPAQVSRDALKKSKRDYGSGGAGVSFAEVIASSITTGDGGNVNDFMALLGSRPAWGQALALTGVDGLKKGGFPAPESESRAEYFYVNVGIGPDNYADIKKVPDKEFSETITFRLIANW